MKHLNSVLKLFSMVAFISLIILSPFNYAYSANTQNWQEVASSSNENRYIDLDSIKYKKGKLSVLTKYTQINYETNQTVDNIFSQIEIDCEKRLFKDGSNWLAPKDKLMKETIINSCML
tara:strand:+ start:2796 stop:3152 length:357 start_codon:yes stop_codon:yes gene_type:complete